MTGDFSVAWAKQLLSCIAINDLKGLNGLTLGPVQFTAKRFYRELNEGHRNIES